MCPPPRRPAEIKPCSRLLFQLAADPSAKPATLREAWAQRMHAVCARVRQQAAMLQKHSHTRLASRLDEACGEQGQHAHTKRQRVLA